MKATRSGRCGVRGISVFALFVASTSTLMACSGGDAAERPGAVDVNKAKVSSESVLGGVFRAARQNDAAGGLERLVAGAIQAQSIVLVGSKPAPAPAITPPSPAAPSATAGPSASADLVAPLQESPVQSAAPNEVVAGGACACDAHKCTYVDCRPVGTSGIVINGTFSFSKDAVVCEGLRYEMTSRAATVSITLACDVKLAGMTMAGTIRSAGVVRMQAQPSAKVTFEDLGWSSSTTLDVLYGPSGSTYRATAGSAAVDATASYGDQTFTGHADVRFP